jgi:hypothetical protein
MIKFADMALTIEYFMSLLWGGIDYPGLVYAVDPFTIALIASALGKGVKAYRDIEEGDEMMRKGEEGYDDFTKKLMDIASEERKLDQGFYDLEQAQRDATEFQRQNMQDMAARAEGTLLRNVTSRTAPNVAQNISALQRQTTQNLGALAGQDLNARASLLKRQQAVDDENFMRKFNMEKYLYGTERERAAASAEAGRLQSDAGMDSMVDIIPQTLGTFANLEASGLMGENRTTPDPSTNFDFNSLNTPVSELELQRMYQFLTPEQLMLMGLPTEQGVDPQQNPITDPNAQFTEKGGIVKAKAGAAFVTPGEFSHETNPQNVRAEDGKMIFENKKGEDIAEVTGQEIIVKDKGKEEGVVVIDPNTAVSMEELVEKGDKEGLFDFFKNFFMKKKQEQEEHEAMKEQMQEGNV